MRNLLKHWQWAAGVACILAFAALFSMRLGLFESSPKDSQAAMQAANKIPGTVSWMNIFQNGKKIGYANRRFNKSGTGYVFSETVFMKLAMMGQEQDVRFQTSGSLTQDLKLDRFDFSLGTGLTALAVRGRMEGKDLVLETGQDAAQTRIPMQEAPYLGDGLMAAVALSKMRPGETRAFPVFDPATTSQRPARVTVVKDTQIPIMGRQVPARQVTVAFLGSTQSAWISQDGEVLAEESPLGIRMEKVSRQKALAGDLVAEGADLTEFAAVPVNVLIPDPQKLTCLKLKVQGPDDSLSGLAGGRQTFEDSVLTVCRESLPARPAPAGEALDAVALTTYLASGPFVQSADARIIQTAKTIVAASGTPEAKARQIVDWVYKNVEKTPVVSVPDALETLKTRKGDCNEHAVLVTALGRAAGVPTRIETGLVYLRGRFYYHAWNAFYLGSWITADAAFGQFPADVTHLRFVSGDPRSWVDVMGLLGQLQLTILEQRP